ncbi:hypothetical protein P9C02_22965 [Bacillus paralicheniformis]|nr:hypothetical protein [Bacillus paralicheniformis]MEC1193283.1 hypothetical protein [Bacillus paralicheniformis]MEC1282460.1 hypothetical protein [Bacillus paralicheniformis]
MINEDKAGTVFGGTIRICFHQYGFFTVYREELAAAAAYLQTDLA